MSGFAHVEFEGLAKQQEEMLRGQWAVLDLGCLQEVGRGRERFCQ